jgi:hypothetical protein
LTCSSARPGEAAREALTATSPPLLSRRRTAEALRAPAAGAGPPHGRRASSIFLLPLSLSWQRLVRVFLCAGESGCAVRLGTGRLSAVWGEARVGLVVEEGPRGEGERWGA